MPDLSAEIEAVKAVYAAINRNDMAAALRDFDPAIERVEPPGFPGTGTYHGLEAIKTHFAKARAAWAEGACEPRRVIVAGNNVIVLVDVNVRLQTENEWRRGKVADVFTFRGGKVVLFRTFVDAQQALDWAGVKDPDMQ